MLESKSTASVLWQIPLRFFCFCFSRLDCHVRFLLLDATISSFCLLPCNNNPQANQTQQQLPQPSSPWHDALIGGCHVIAFCLLKKETTTTLTRKNSNKDKDNPRSFALFATVGSPPAKKTKKGNNNNHHEKPKRSKGNNPLLLRSTFTRFHIFTLQPLGVCTFRSIRGISVRNVQEDCVVFCTPNTPHHFSVVRAQLLLHFPPAAGGLYISFHLGHFGTKCTGALCHFLYTPYTPTFFQPPHCRWRGNMRRNPLPMRLSSNHRLPLFFSPFHALFSLPSYRRRPLHQFSSMFCFGGFAWRCWHGLSTASKLCSFSCFFGFVAF